MSRCQQLPWNVLLPRSLKIELHPTDMCKFLLEEKHIYLLKNGRISMAGVSDSNLDYIAKSMDEAVRKFGWKNRLLSTSVRSIIEWRRSIHYFTQVRFTGDIGLVCVVASPLLNSWSPKPINEVASMPRQAALVAFASFTQPLIRKNEFPLQIICLVLDCILINTKWFQTRPRMMPLTLNRCQSLRDNLKVSNSMTTLTSSSSNHDLYSVVSINKT